MQQATVIINGELENPIWIELISGKIYAIPESSIKKLGNLTIIENVPIYDSPVVITDKSIISSLIIR